MTGSTPTSADTSSVRDATLEEVARWCDEESAASSIAGKATLRFAAQDIRAMKGAK